jgi:hypothetical protein
LVLVTHDESTFNANDGKRRLWIEKDKQPLRAKSRGKGIMVSGFLTPGVILKIPDHIKYYLHCVRTIEAYKEGLSYGTAAFAQRMQKNHRQVSDSSKW